MSSKLNSDVYLTLRYYIYKIQLQHTFGCLLLYVKRFIFAYKINNIPTIQIGMEKFKKKNKNEKEMEVLRFSINNYLYTLYK